MTDSEGAETQPAIDSAAPMTRGGSGGNNATWQLCHIGPRPGAASRPKSSAESASGRARSACLNRLSHIGMQPKAVTDLIPSDAVRLELAGTVCLDKRHHPCSGLNGLALSEAKMRGSLVISEPWVSVEDVARHIGVAADGRLLGQTVTDGTPYLVVVRVRSNDAGPYTYDGRGFVRVGNTTPRIKCEEVEHLVLTRLRAKHRWENLPATGRCIKDLDANQINQTVVDAVAAKRLSAVPSESRGESWSVELCEAAGARRPEFLEEAGELGVKFWPAFALEQPVTAPALTGPQNDLLAAIRGDALSLAELVDAADRENRAERSRSCSRARTRSSDTARYAAVGGDGE